MFKNKKDEDHTHEHEHSIKEIFTGGRSLFTLAGAAVGAIMVGRTLWEWSQIYLGLPETFLIGILIFTVSDYVMDRFHNE